MSGSVRGRVCCRLRVCASLLQTPSLRVRPGWKPLDAMEGSLSRRTSSLGAEQRMHLRPGGQQGTARARLVQQLPPSAPGLIPGAVGLQLGRMPSLRGGGGAVGGVARRAEVGVERHLGKACAAHTHTPSKRGKRVSGHAKGRVRTPDGACGHALCLFKGMYMRGAARLSILGRPRVGRGW